MNTSSKVFPYRCPVFSGRLLIRCLLAFFALGIVLQLVGCHVHMPKKRGLLFRGDWAFEINRTPWVGAPTGTASGCDLVVEDDGYCEGGYTCIQCNLPHALGKCKLGQRIRGELLGEEVEDGENKEETPLSAGKFRRHCGLQPTCTRERPCGSTPGCGVLVDTSDPLAMVRAGFLPGMTFHACGLTPHCSQAAPCGQTPRCALPVRANIPQQSFAPQAIALTPIPGSGIAAGSAMIPVGTAVPPGGLLPSGGLVGVTGMVHRSCGLSPQCGPGRPCGLTPQCAALVPPAAATPNLVLLADSMGGNMSGTAVMTPGTIQVAPNGALVAASGGMVGSPGSQIVHGMSMSGHPQTGYPPIGYAEEGYSPGSPRLPDMDDREYDEETLAKKEAKRKEEAVAKSSMPYPRHHPLPTRPAFERSPGMGKAGRQAEDGQSTSETKTAQPAKSKAKSSVTDEETEENRDSAIQQAYLKGMIAAMKQQQTQNGGVTQASYNPQQPNVRTAVPAATPQMPYGQNPYVQTPYGNAVPQQRTGPLGLFPQPSATGTPLLGWLGLVKNSAPVNPQQYVPMTQAGQMPQTVSTPQNLYAAQNLDNTQNMQVAQNQQLLLMLKAKNMQETKTAENAASVPNKKAGKKAAAPTKRRVSDDEEEWEDEIDDSDRELAVKPKARSMSTAQSQNVSSNDSSKVRKSQVDANQKVAVSSRRAPLPMDPEPLPSPQRKVAVKRSAAPNPEDLESLNDLEEMEVPVPTKPPTLAVKPSGTDAPTSSIIQQAAY